MGLITVGIGEWVVSGISGDEIKTYALGSCLAVLAWDRVVHLGGMVHIALPDSTITRDKDRYPEGYFADTGLAALIREMEAMGGMRRNWWIKLIGGASMMDRDGVFDIGKRNILAAKRILWKNSLGPVAEETGSNMSRTVSLRVIDGETTISSGNKHWLL